MDLLPIPGEWLIQGGAVAMLGWVVLMIFRGGLVPRRTHEELMRDRDTWRAVALKAMGQNEALLPAAQITTKVVNALSDAAAPKDDGGAR